MIFNFVCQECKKYKSHGRPQKNGKWTCIDCLNKKRGIYDRKKNKIY